MYATAVAAEVPKALNIKPRTEVLVHAGIFEVLLGVAMDVILAVGVSRSVIPLATHD